MREHDTAFGRVEPSLTDPQAIAARIAGRFENDKVGQYLNRAASSSKEPAKTDHDDCDPRDTSTAPYREFRGCVHESSIVENSRQIETRGIEGFERRTWYKSSRQERQHIRQPDSNMPRLTLSRSYRTGTLPTSLPSYQPARCRRSGRYGRFRRPSATDHRSAERRIAALPLQQGRGIEIAQSSTCSEMLSASSTSIPR